MKLKTFLLAVIFGGISTGYAQTLPLGLLDNIEDSFRRQQLISHDTSLRSFMIRPLFFDTDREGKKSLQGYSFENFSTALWESNNGKSGLYALPVTWQQQYSTHHPYGINDGAMILAKGYETMFSAGVFFKAGILSVQLKPEYVFAENKDYPDIIDYNQPASLINNFFTYYNNIDVPHKFGEGTYSKFNWGQSSVRLTYKGVSVGISNENLWWGPGTKNSLLMTNNAAGFKHLTLNTVRPIKTAIGSFEGQLIAGRLENSDVAAPAGYPDKKKLDDWRYINGIAITYHPKWVDGLFFGLDRTFMVYRSDMGSGFGSYFPVFTGVTKSAFETAGGQNSDDEKRRDQYFSLFTRWVMPESHSEIYLQFGRTDHAWNFRDAVLEPEHSRAYVAGFRKLIPFLDRQDEFLQVGVEVTQIESSSTSQVRKDSYFYTHSEVRQGYTNKGQFLGAGIGTDNMQSVDVDWVKGFKRIGLTVERRVHNPDLYRFAFDETNNPRRHWVDFSAVAKFDWTFSKFILNSQLAYIRSLNYQYVYEELPGALYWYGYGNDTNNFNFKIGLMYRL